MADDIIYDPLACENIEEDEDDGEELPGYEQWECGANNILDSTTKYDSQLPFEESFYDGDEVTYFKEFGLWMVRRHLEEVPTPSVGSVSSPAGTSRQTSNTAPSRRRVDPSKPELIANMASWLRGSDPARQPIQQFKPQYPTKRIWRDAALPKFAAAVPSTQNSQGRWPTVPAAMGLRTPSSSSIARPQIPCTPIPSGTLNIPQPRTSQARVSTAQRPCTPIPSGTLNIPRPNTSQARVPTAQRPCTPIPSGTLNIPRPSTSQARVSTAQRPWAPVPAQMGYRTQSSLSIDRRPSSAASGSPSRLSDAHDPERKKCHECGRRFKNVRMIPCGCFELCRECVYAHSIGDNCPSCGKEIQDIKIDNRFYRK